MGRFSKVLNRGSTPQTPEQAAPRYMSETPESLIEQVVPAPQETASPEISSGTESVATAPVQTPKKVTPPAPEPNPEASKNLETKIKLHGLILDEIDLASLEGLTEHDLVSAVKVIVKDLTVREGMKLNSSEIQDLVVGIIDEMRGLGPLEVSAARSRQCQRYPDQHP